MANNFEFVIDFLVDLKTDKSKVEKLSKELTAILGTIKPEIDLNSKDKQKEIQKLTEILIEAEDGAEKLEQVFQALDINIDTAELEAAFAEIEDTIASIEKIDTSDIFKGLESSGLDATIEKLDAAFDGLDDEAFN